MKQIDELKEIKTKLKKDLSEIYMRLMDEHTEQLITVEDNYFLLDKCARDLNEINLRLRDELYEKNTELSDVEDINLNEIVEIDTISEDRKVEINNQSDVSEFNETNIKLREELQPEQKILEFFGYKISPIKCEGDEFWCFKSPWKTTIFDEHDIYNEKYPVYDQNNKVVGHVFYGNYYGGSCKKDMRIDSDDISWFETEEYGSEGENSYNFRLHTNIYGDSKELVINEDGFYLMKGYYIVFGVKFDPEYFKIYKDNGRYESILYNTTPSDSEINRDFTYYSKDENSEKTVVIKETKTGQVLRFEENEVEIEKYDEPYGEYYTESEYSENLEELNCDFKTAISMEETPLAIGEAMKDFLRCLPIAENSMKELLGNNLQLEGISNNSMQNEKQKTFKIESNNKNK